VASFFHLPAGGQVKLLRKISITDKIYISEVLYIRDEILGANDNDF